MKNSKNVNVQMAILKKMLFVFLILHVLKDIQVLKETAIK
jgi:hypothetical protein